MSRMNDAGSERGTRNGRGKALEVLDRFLARKEIRKALMTALEAELQQHPVRFFRTAVMPLLPRNARLTVPQNGIVKWESLVDVSQRVLDADRETAARLMASQPGHRAP